MQGPAGARGLVAGEARAEAALSDTASQPAERDVIYLDGVAHGAGGSLRLLPSRLRSSRMLAGLN